MAGFSLLTVEGAPGSGKTRLLREAVAMAEELGFLTVSGNAEQRHRLTSTKAVAPVRPTEVRRHPVLFAVDDAHLLGEEEMATLLAHRRRTAGTAVVWIVVRRPGGSSLVDTVLPKPTSMRERIILGPLSPCATRTLAVDILGMPPTPALADLIDTAGGNPMMVVELLEGMHREGTLRTVRPEAELVVDRVPESLHLLVRSMLKDYSVQCRKLLRVAAVLGKELAFGQLATLLNLSLPALLPVLEEACDSGVVSCDDDQGVSFRSELLWRVVTDSVPHALREELVSHARSLGADRPSRAEARPRTSTPSTSDTERAVSKLEPAPEITVDNPFLNEQERTIISLVGAGLTNRQIARRIYLSPHTVNYHLKKIFRTFGVTSRIGLLDAVRRQEIET
ncbi:LuxR C-terminal-related transcriptional regulator [Actinokineospora sp.]|uniref:response regulator transcription factor n=1 Tax=Actinokineospora sp. TaxID=1872133 RepID=UPI003D6C24F8